MTPHAHLAVQKPGEPAGILAEEPSAGTKPELSGCKLRAGWGRTRGYCRLHRRRGLPSPDPPPPHPAQPSRPEMTDSADVCSPASPSSGTAPGEGAQSRAWGVDASHLPDILVRGRRTRRHAESFLQLLRPLGSSSPSCPQTRLLQVWAHISLSGGLPSDPCTIPRSAPGRQRRQCI